jgi:hypothetical protein
VSIRHTPRDQLRLGETRLRVLYDDPHLGRVSDIPAGAFAGFSDDIGYVYVSFPGHPEPFDFPVDCVEVVR